MKKLLSALCLLLALTCLLAACKEEDVHTHSFGAWSATKEATCTEKGEETRTCSCGESETQEIPVKSHKFGSWSVLKEATCGDAGEKQRTCSVCSFTQSARIAATEAHRFDASQVCSDCGAAWEYTAAGILYEENGDTCTVSGVESGVAANIVIPYYHNGKRVTAIGNDAFQNNTSIKSVKLPMGVTSIGSTAFVNCSSLTDISIPASVTSIGPSAFAGCTGLIRNEDGVSYVDKWVIDCDSGVTSVSLRADTVGIADVAFHNTLSLTSITIPASVISIGEDAFASSSNLASVTFEQGSQLKSIGGYAFARCSALTSISIPEGVTGIGLGAFNECVGLTDVSIPATVTCIDDFAFYGCRGLERVTFAEGSQLKNIGRYAFNGCIELTGVVIPAGVTRIEDYAFSECSKLLQKENGVSYVDKWAIKCDSGVTSVSLRADTVAIADEAFYNNDVLVSVTVPEGVRIIGNAAFYSCGELKSVIISSSVTFIAPNAFGACVRLESVTFENTAGWQVSQEEAASGAAVDVSVPTANDNLLVYTYTNYYWKRTVSA